MAKTQDELDMLLFRAERALAAAERKTPPDADEVRRLRRSVAAYKRHAKLGPDGLSAAAVAATSSPLRGAIIMAA